MHSRRGQGDLALRPTNILFINSDQHSPRILGCYGHPIVKTPNLDRLAARGTLFRNAYCPTPICVPSRACLATGRYAHTIDSWDNGTPYVGTEADSWGHRLIDRGHKVTTIGKLHYRKDGDPSGFPDQRIPMHVLDGVGDVYGCLRDKMPVRPQSRKQVFEARAGEVEYTRYDRATTAEAIRWLTGESTTESKPWALFCSYTYPHFPLVVPEEYFNLYDPASVPLPVDWQSERWSQHPWHQWQRNIQALDQPIDEAAIRNAIVAYYGMVTFLDDQIGQVLRALDESGQTGNTRIVYTSDHGEQLGEHGMWWKSSMLEASAGIPMIVAGPDIPAGKVSNTPVNLVDCYPGIVQGVGEALTPKDSDLPGRSIFDLAAEPDHDRVSFSEYHAILSPCAAYMVRNARYKYVHYAGDMPPQLFDMVWDNQEQRDLGQDPAYAGVRARMEAELRKICDPELQDRRAKESQWARVMANGGPEAVLDAGVKIPYTPAPDAFEPAPVEARERARASASGG
jgi:choline-sulfatase